MKKIVFTSFLMVSQLFVYAQETIDFDFSYPENSKFIVEQKVDNSGTMKITGSPQEIAAIKKAGYNEVRKLKYIINYTTEFKTKSKTSNSFPFEFSYNNILFDIDSDGKKQKKEMSFTNDIINGDVVNDKLSVVKSAETDSPQKDQYINSLPKYFTVDFPKMSNMKIGDSFTVKRKTDNKTEGFAMDAELKYTLTKIENNFAYFSIIINQKNNESSPLKSTGNGKGDMIYNYKDKFILSENMNIKMNSIVNENVKMIVDNTIISSYKLTLK